MEWLGCILGALGFGKAWIWTEPASFASLEQEAQHCQKCDAEAKYESEGQHPEPSVLTYGRSIRGKREEG